MPRRFLLALVLVAAVAGGVPAHAAAQTEAPPETAADAPDMVISGRDVRMTPAGVAGVRIGCLSLDASETCSGTLTLTLARAVLVPGRRGRRPGAAPKRRVGPFTMGTTSFTMPAGSARLLRIRLSVRARSVVRQLGSVFVKVEARYTGRSGQPARAGRTITLYYPRR
jgi:hypothetical protein